MDVFQPSYQLDRQLNCAEISVQDGPISNKGYYSLTEKFSVTSVCAKPPPLHSRQATISPSTGLGLVLGPQSDLEQRKLRAARTGHGPKNQSMGQGHSYKLKGDQQKGNLQKNFFSP